MTTDPRKVAVLVALAAIAYQVLRRPAPARAAELAPAAGVTFEKLVPVTTAPGEADEHAYRPKPEVRPFAVTAADVKAEADRAMQASQEEFNRRAAIVVAQQAGAAVAGFGYL